MKLLKKSKSNGAGWLTNVIPSGFGALMALDQYRQALNENIPEYSFPTQNPNAGYLNQLLGININPYPVLNNMRSLYNNLAYTTKNSGGLSGQQKGAQLIAGLDKLQQNIANFQLESQRLNNQYKLDALKALAASGESLAQRNLQASQAATDFRERAYGAKRQGQQMGIRNLLDQMQGYFANEFKRQQFNKMYDLYAADSELNRDYIKSLMSKPTIQKSPVQRMKAQRIPNNPEEDRMFYNMFGDFGISDYIKLINGRL